MADKETENLILAAVEASVDAAYLRLKENSLNEINGRLDSLEGRMDSLESTVKKGFTLIGRELRASWSVGVDWDAEEV